MNVSNVALFQLIFIFFVQYSKGEQGNQGDEGWLGNFIPHIAACNFGHFSFFCSVFQRRAGQRGWLYSEERCDLPHNFLFSCFMTYIM